MQLFLFVLGSIGLTHLIVEGSIFAPLRQFLGDRVPILGSLVTCYRCCGFWAGLFCGWAVLTTDPWQVFLCGCAGSFMANLAAVITDYLMIKSQ